MSKTRKRRVNFTAQEKVRVLREHLLEGVPVSDVCDRHGISPSQFYTWQKQLFEEGAKAFDRSQPARERDLERKIARLEAKARERDEVIVEVTQEMVRLKKGSGGI
jgi:transposase-like protein